MKRIHPLHSNSFCYLYTNDSDGYELNRNGIISYTMNQLYQIENVIGILNPIIALRNIIDTIALQIEILVAIYVIAGKRSLFIFIHGMFIYIGDQIQDQSNTTNLSTSRSYLITNDIDNVEVIVSIIIEIITIISQTDQMDIIFIVTNVVMIHKLDTREIMCASSMNVEILGVYLMEIKLFQS